MRRTLRASEFLYRQKVQQQKCCKCNEVFGDGEARCSIQHVKAGYLFIDQFNKSRQAIDALGQGRLGRVNARR
jgi:hypothetical protein